MSKKTTSDQLLERLHAWGVRRVFGYPGDGINGLMGAFGRIGERMEFVQARHEELAAFMATAHAKFTGEVGVCMATSGPGAIHLLNGLYDAKADHQPVVAIVGQSARSAIGGDYQQEVDLPCLFKDVAHEYVQVGMVHAQIRHLVDRALRIARDLKIRRGMMASLSGGLATMGPAMPYALAAKLAYPQRVPIALSGDGAMQMIGINALVTVAHRYKQWADPRFVVLVLNNSDLNMVTWEQRVSAGDPKFEASQALPAFPYAEYARALGLRGLRVDRPEAIAGAIDEALHADRPMVLEMVTDPAVPPLPPHVTPKQAKAYARALAHRDPEAVQTVIATAKEWWDGLRAGRHGGK